MRDLDLIVILTQTDGEHDAEITDGTEALYQRNLSKATKVLKVGFTQALKVDEKLDAKGLPDSPAIGIYVIGHAFRENLFGKTFAFQGIKAEQLSGYIAKLVQESFKDPKLMKVVLLGCVLGGGAEEDESKVAAGKGSYLQTFCLCLGKDHRLSPKVAGWDSYVTIVREEGGGAAPDDRGRKSVSPQKKNKPMKEASRTKHKKYYVWREGKVAALEAAEWSDKPVEMPETKPAKGAKK
jgi:hypothetical protein